MLNQPPKELAADLREQIKAKIEKLVAGRVAAAREADRRAAEAETRQTRRVEFAAKRRDRARRLGVLAAQEDSPPRRRGRQEQEGSPMASIPLGAKGTFALAVAPQHLANRFKDATLPPVLATPVMIMVMENAALNALKPYLAPGESALGTAVDVRHVAATPAGQRIVAEAEVTAVEGRRIRFKLSARDEREEIGYGTHERVIVALDRIAARLAAKRRD